jgi:hypothetical protein
MLHIFPSHAFSQTTVFNPNVFLLLSDNLNSTWGSFAVINGLLNFFFKIVFLNNWLNWPIFINCRHSSSCRGLLRLIFSIYMKMLLLLININLDPRRLLHRTHNPLGFDLLQFLLIILFLLLIVRLHCNIFRRLSLLIVLGHLVLSAADVSAVFGVIIQNLWLFNFFSLNFLFFFANFSLSRSVHSKFICCYQHFL